MATVAGLAMSPLLFQCGHCHSTCCAKTCRLRQDCTRVGVDVEHVVNKDCTGNTVSQSGSFRRRHQSAGHPATRQGPGHMADEVSTPMTGWCTAATASPVPQPRSTMVPGSLAYRLTICASSAVSRPPHHTHLKATTNITTPVPWSTALFALMDATLGLGPRRRTWGTRRIRPIVTSFGVSGSIEDNGQSGAAAQ